jgi:hypothetical protein
MAVIDTISQLKNQGVPTGKIIQSLKEQGYSPKEINEALSQSEIKTALTTASTKYGDDLPATQNALDTPPIPQQEDYFTMPQSQSRFYYHHRTRAKTYGSYDSDLKPTSFRLHLRETRNVPVFSRRTNGKGKYPLCLHRFPEAPVSARVHHQGKVKRKSDHSCLEG